MKVRWTEVFWIASAVVAVVAALSGFSVLLAAVPVVAAAIAQILASRREAKADRADLAKKKIDELYGPWAQIAKMRLQHAMPDFRQYMTHELGELRLHLAEPATRAAYLRLDREGKWGGAEELEFARAFLADHERLVDEYRRLTGSGP